MDSSEGVARVASYGESQSQGNEYISSTFSGGGVAPQIAGSAEAVEMEQQQATATIDPEFYDTAVGDDQDMDDIITRMMDAQLARGDGGGTAPASAAVIARLKKRKVDESMLDANGKADCTVCTDDVNVGEMVTELPCKHWFHETCIDEWLSAHGNCPHCRENLPPESDREADDKGKQPVKGPELGQGSQQLGFRSHHHDSHDPFDTYRDEMLARSIYMAERPSIYDDEAFARSLQDEHDKNQRTFAVDNDEAFARKLHEESRPSVDDDEALARRLYDESKPSVDDDAKMARQLHEESEDLARKLQEENAMAIHNDEAMARRLQEEADRETGYGPSGPSGPGSGQIVESDRDGRGRTPIRWDDHGSYLRNRGPPSSGTRSALVASGGGGSFSSPDHGNGYRPSPSSFSPPFHRAAGGAAGHADYEDGHEHPNRSDGYSPATDREDE